MQNNRGIVDLDTGEVIRKIEDGEHFVCRQSIEYMHAISKKALSNRGFIRIDQKEGKQIAKELSANEKALLFTLSYYVSYQSGLIRHINGKDLCLNDIVILMGWSRPTTTETLNSLIKKDIIYKGKNGKSIQLFMNPWVASRGVAVNKTLFEMFKNYKVRSLGGKTWEEIEHGYQR